MEYAHALKQNETMPAVPAEDVAELTIHDVLNGMVTFDEYRSSQEERDRRDDAVLVVSEPYVHSG